MEDPIIYGSGLTAALAGIVFPNSRIITDKVKEPHKALLRFRSDDISKMTGIPFKKVQVYKDVHTDQGKIAAMNSYSKKVTGGYYDRSLADLSTVTRWVAPVDFYEQVYQSMNMGDRLEVVEELHSLAYRTDRPPIISTMPINTFATMQIPKTSASSIYVTKLEIVDCDLYQTVYFPDFNTNVYRITIEGDIAIIESIAPIQLMEADVLLHEAFHIEPLGSFEHNYEQAIGKMTPIDEEDRRMTICELTTKYNIYSLGRVACWRPKTLLDDCLQDAHKIKDMIRLHPYERAMKWQ